MKKSVILAAIFISVLAGCKNGEKNELVSEETIESVDNSSAEIDSHNSENSLDWMGVYEGTTPCADCEGIKTVLELKSDKTFVLSQTYLGKPVGENEFIQNGSFAWNQEGTMIRLRTESGAYQYKVGENQLWLLDEKGSMIEGDLADRYILKKTIQ